MQRGARLQALIELAENLLAEWQAESPRPADRTLRYFLQSRRYIGSSDRRALSAEFFSMLRHIGLAQESCQRIGIPLTGRSLALLSSQSQLSQTELVALCNGEKYHPEPLSDAEAALLAQYAAEPSFAARHNLPQWLAQKLQAQYNAQAEALCHALQKPATPDIRINPKAGTVSSIAHRLQSGGIATQPIDGVSLALEVVQPQPLTSLPLYQQGAFELQDRGSQALCEIAAALQPATMLDFCAGAGGKSLTMTALLGDDCAITATDIHARRLQEMQPRLARAGATSIAVKDYETLVSSGHAKQYDLVWADVPCSGVGTLRRHPDLAWRLTPEALAKLLDLQREILDKAALFVKPGGWLFYTTCSVLNEENERQAEWLVAFNPKFRVVRPPKMWMMGREEDDAYARFMPHTHLSDGFFASLLKRHAQD